MSEEQRPPEEQNVARTAVPHCNPELDEESPLPSAGRSESDVNPPRQWSAQERVSHQHHGELPEEKQFLVWDWRTWSFLGQSASLPFAVQRMLVMKEDVRSFAMLDMKRGTEVAEIGRFFEGSCRKPTST